MSEGNAKRHTIRLLHRLWLSLLSRNIRPIGRLFMQAAFEHDFGSEHMKASRQALMASGGLI